MAPRIPSLASSHGTRHSTRSLAASSTLGSVKNHTSVKLKGHNEIATCPQRSATAVAKAILQQLQISDSEKEDSTDFEDLDSDDGSNGDETETMNDRDDRDEDGAISEPEGPGSESGDGSDIVVLVKDILATRKGVPKVTVPVASRGTQKKPKVQAIHEEESSDSEFDDEFREFV